MHREHGPRLAISLSCEEIVRDLPLPQPASPKADGLRAGHVESGNSSSRRVTARCRGPKARALNSSIWVCLGSTRCHPNFVCSSHYATLFMHRSCRRSSPTMKHEMGQIQHRVTLSARSRDKLTRSKGQKRHILGELTALESDVWPGRDCMTRETWRTRKAPFLVYCGGSQTKTVAEDRK